MSNRRAPTLCKHTVSGLFHRPHRAAFHLSLTVLFTIDHETYLAFPDSPGWFPQHFHVSRYSRTETESLFVFAYGAFTRFGQAFQPVRLTHRFVTFLSSQSQNPDPQLSGFRALRPKEKVSTLQPQALNCLSTWFGLVPFRSPLLRECCVQSTLRFLFLWVLRCFTSPGLLPRCLMHRDN